MNAFEKFKTAARMYKGGSTGEEIDTAISDRYRRGQAITEYGNTLQGLYNDPGQMFTPEEEAAYMANVKREGELSTREQLGGYDQWAARRNISGGPEVDVRLKLMQENIRNIMRAKTGLNSLSATQRATTRMAALQGMGNVASQQESFNFAEYQRQIQEEQARENRIGELLGFGVRMAMNYALPGSGEAMNAVGSTGAGTRIDWEGNSLA